jgi:hypothetical protein
VNPPTDEQALEALRTLRAWLGLGAGAPTVYTADALPPGVRSRSAFLERHRERVASGVEGWSRAGQTRQVTRQAWELDVDQQTKRTRRKVVAVPAANDAAPRDISAELDERLGIRVHGRGAR